MKLTFMGHVCDGCLRLPEDCVCPSPAPADGSAAYIIRSANPTIYHTRRNVNMIFDTEKEAKEFFDALREFRQQNDEVSDAGPGASVSNTKTASRPGVREH